MLNSRRYSREAGITLVEMLVVIGIIALIAGITVPTMARYGFMFGNRLQNASREVYSTLRAAQIYAASNRVDTAVAFMYRTDLDSQTGVERQILDGYAILRRITPQEIDVWSNVFTTAHNLDWMFVPLQTPEGSFTRIEEGTSVLIDYDNPGTISMRGLEGVQVFAPEPNGVFRFITPTPGIDYPLDSLPNSFGAFIFSPGGVMVSTALPERFEVRMGLLPSEEADLRHVDDANTEERFIQIELYKSTGRVKIAKKQNEV